MTTATFKKIPPPPPPIHLVDDEKIVNNSWHEWFTRLWTFVNSLYDLVLSIDVSNTIINEGAFVPYYIAPGETFVVPLYKQALFAMDIDNQGILEVDGFLIQVAF